MATTTDKKVLQVTKRWGSDYIHSIEQFDLGKFPIGTSTDESGFTVSVDIVEREEYDRSSTERNLTPYGLIGLSAFSHAAVLSSLAMYTPPLGLDDGEGYSKDQMYLMQQYLNASAEREQEQRETESVATEKADDREGGTGTRAKGEEGSMGNPNSRDANKRYGVAGPKDNQDPHIARSAALREAAEFGMIGLLNTGAGGDPNAPTAPWGRDDSMGTDPISARGNMWGDSIGDAFGAGGLGLSGIGEGGGGRARGERGGKIALGFEGVFQERVEAVAAHEDRAAEAAVEKREAQILAVALLLQHERVRRVEAADTENVKRKNLEHVAARESTERAVLAGGIQAGERSLKLCGGPEAVEHACMFGAVAGGEYVGMRGRQPVIHDDALLCA